MNIALPLFFSVVPLIFCRGFHDAFSLPKYVAISAGVLILFLALLQRCRQERRLVIPQSPFYLPLILLLGAQVVSLVKATNAYIALICIGNSLLFLSFFFFMLQFLGDCPSFLSSKKGTVPLTKGTGTLREPVPFFPWIVLAGAVICIYGIFQNFGCDFFVWSIKNSPISTLGRRNFTGEYLVAIIPYALLLFLTDKKKPAKWLFFLALLLFLFTLFLTFTRASWLGFLASGLYMMGLLKSRCFSRKTVVNLTLLVTLLLPFTASPEILKFEPGTVFSRMLIWKATLVMIKKNPFLGVGAGNFETVYPLYAREVPGSLTPLAERVGNAHNEYLEIAGETGIPGLLVFLFLVFTIFRVTFTILRRSPEEDRPLAIFASASILAILVNSLAAFPLKNPSVLLYFYLDLALLSCLYVRTCSLPPRVANVSFGVLSLLSFLALLVFFCGSFVSMRSSFTLRKSETYMHRASQRQDPLEWTKAEKYGREAVFWNPYSIETHFQLGSVYLAGNFPVHAREEFEAAFKLHPNSDTISNNLAMAWHRSGNLSQAEKFYLWSLQLNPDRPETHNNLGSLYLERGEIDLALKHFRAALATDPDYAPALLNLRQK